MKSQSNDTFKEDLFVWNLLFKRQIANLENKASGLYLDAVNRMSSVLSDHSLPDFKLINDWFYELTGWEIVSAPGLIPVDEFFDLLAQKKFPSSRWLRTRDKLDYLDEPDMFHDIFGHIPLLSNPSYSDFIERFGKIGVTLFNDSESLKKLQRLYWYTIEFGLIKESNQLKIYGAGLISSFGESIACFDDNVILLPFDLERILETDFNPSEMQTTYFVLDSMDDLNKAIDKLTLKWI